MEEPIVNEEGEVEEVFDIEEPNTIPLPSLPMLRLVKKRDGSLEVFAAAKTHEWVCQLFDHALARLRTEFNGKTEGKEKKQDYMG